MNKEKIMLQSRTSSGEYLAPKVKVVGVKARRVLCSSITDMSFSSSNQTDSDFDDN